MEREEKLVLVQLSGGYVVAVRESEVQSTIREDLDNQD